MTEYEVSTYKNMWTIRELCLQIGKVKSLLSNSDRQEM